MTALPMLPKLKTLRVSGYDILIDHEKGKYIWGRNSGENRVQGQYTIVANGMYGWYRTEYPGFWRNPKPTPEYTVSLFHPRLTEETVAKLPKEELDQDFVKVDVAEATQPSDMQVKLGMFMGSHDDGFESTYELFMHDKSDSMFTVLVEISLRMLKKEDGDEVIRAKLKKLNAPDDVQRRLFGEILRRSLEVD